MIAISMAFAKLISET